MNTHTFYFDDIEDIVALGHYKRKDIYDYFESVLKQNYQIELKQTKAATELPPIVVFKNVSEFQKWRSERVKRQEDIIDQLKKLNSNESQ